jgi:hypothetical protein
VRSLLEDYHFNVETLAKYLSVSVESVYEIAKGNMEKLPADFIERTRILNKIMFLAVIPEEVPDLRVKAFLETLLSYHKLSKETIAKMAEIEILDIDNFLSDKCENMNNEIKYKIASITMALRFFLKDNEPKQ